MKVFCILSDERAHRSRSPAMFSAVLQRCGIKGAYVPFVVRPDQLGQAVQSLRVLHMAGANITVPYKERVIPFLDILSEGANIIGAVNTIVISGDQLKGYNTNAIGFMDAMSGAGFDAEGKSALVFGTGGAAKAVVFILNWLRTEKIFVTGRNEPKTGAMVERLGGEALSLAALANASLKVDLVVNATAVSDPDESPELARLTANLTLPQCELLVDLNYGRVNNFWQALAQRQEIRFMDGLDSLAFQARRTFALWTGAQVPPADFIRALTMPADSGP
ncbi:MAG: shikimate dehydrogenase [Desulfobacterales bacterium]|jgi:shikimate dehydrogenase